MVSPQFTYFFIRGYFQDASQVLKACEACDFRHYAYILHDKDTWTIASEQHNVGDLKDPHWHICLNLMQKQTWKWVKARIEHACGSNCGLHVEDIHDIKEAVDYLIHNSEVSIKQGKHLYPASDIFSDDIFHWHKDSTRAENAAEKIDLITQFYQEVVSKKYCPRKLLYEYIKVGKRDFIMNYFKCLNAACDTLGVDYSDLFTKPENRKGKNVLERVIQDVCEKG